MTDKDATSEDRWWSNAKRSAPKAFVWGGVAGMTWPFVFVYVVSLFGTGTQLGVTGPKNWADQILMTVMMLGYTGPFFLILLYFAMVFGYRAGGLVAANAIVAVQSRFAEKGHDES